MINTKSITITLVDHFIQTQEMMAKIIPVISIASMTGTRHGSPTMPTSNNFMTLKLFTTFVFDMRTTQMQHTLFMVPEVTKYASRHMLHLQKINARIFSRIFIHAYQERMKHRVRLNGFVHILIVVDRILGNSLRSSQQQTFTHAILNFDILSTLRTQQRQLWKQILRGSISIRQPF